MTDDYFVAPLDESRKPDKANSEMWQDAERISRADMVLLTKPGCQHNFVRDGSEETAEYYAETCTKCPIGRLVPIDS